MSASTRLVLHMRVALVNHTRPYASEELYFWRFTTEADLMALVERALDYSTHAGQAVVRVPPTAALGQKEITAHCADSPHACGYTLGPITWYRGGSSPGGSSGDLCMTWQAGPTATIPARKSHQSQRVETVTWERWGCGASRDPWTKGKTTVLGRRSSLGWPTGGPDYSTRFGRWQSQ